MDYNNDDASISSKTGSFGKIKFPVPLRIIFVIGALGSFMSYQPCVCTKGLKPINVLLLTPGREKYMFSYPRVAPAVTIATKKVESDLNWLKGYTFNITYKDTDCNEALGMNYAIDAFTKTKLHVFLGPICDYTVAPIVRQCKFWNVPMISSGANAWSFITDRKDVYPMLTRVGPINLPAFAQMFIKLLDAYKWHKIKMLYEKSGRDTITADFCHFHIEALHKVLKNVTRIQHDLYKIENFDPEPLLVREISKAYGVVVLCASPHSVREIMIKAHDLNFDNGEYVFFNIDLFTSEDSSLRPWYNETDTDERNEKAKKAYEALLTVTLRKPTNLKYKQFSKEVKRRARIMDSNFTYGEDEVNSFVGAFHDAVILYALALNESLEANVSISNGSEITKRMWNRTFDGITGTVSIDDNGDRNADYSLLDMDPKTKEFRVVADYYGNKKRYEPVPGEPIYWAGGRKEPPPDTPTCGFDGSKCPPDEPFPIYLIVIIVLGTIIVFVVLIALIAYRRFKLEAELAAMNWRVRWEDILFGSPEKGKRLERQGSRMSLNRKGSYNSSCSGDTIAVHLQDGNRQLFTKTGYYKGAIVAIKPISRSNINADRPQLVEIKQIKDLQNDHVVRFIGACVDPPHQCIITEYCPKGSLQDVLENEEIKLDWMFRYSIMQDIVRGMAYLHSGEIKTHGNLKSTNCVVDSRFVVKVTDFGLHNLRKTDDALDEESFASYNRKLWTAPELLRMNNKPDEGTQKGDVFSFAVICQEIVYRKGVFYLGNLEPSPQDIIDKVKKGMKPLFRPMLEDFDCPSDELAAVIRRCWAEDPVDRPDFQNLKSIIRKLNRDGDKGNILDNLLTRMEQYANNLEALVAERTSDYLEEKRKAEDLLYMMLPRTVAIQLIHGESVNAESYDSVTIYFSDICGFTALSAESTAMEVIALLNDLYTTFDTVISQFDVYKVETIGDAYMVVSGLPVRNGNAHAREIARMSLALLKETFSFKVRHKPNYQLKLRIGLHSGPVCAGVVGLKMPRYCLFGDTVNTSSRMESNGEPLKIHVSPQTEEILKTFGSFRLDLRGEVEMKGKGKVTTYWLLGEDENTINPPPYSHGIL